MSKYSLLLLFSLALIGCGGTPATAVPQAPTNVRALPGPGMVRVSWDYLASGNIGFSVFREVVGADGSPLTPMTELTPAPLASDARFFDDTEVKTGVSYRYAVKAVGSGGISSEVRTPSPVQPNAPGGDEPNPPGTFRLEVFRNGSGQGVINSTPAGIACIQRPGETSDCSETYPAGTRVSLRAQADGGSRFVGWTGACSGTGDCQVTLDSDKTVSAAFSQTSVTLSVEVSGAGQVASGPAGISCGDDCSESYPAGTIVVLNATPEADHDFAGWGTPCKGTDGCRLTLTEDITVSATFAEKGAGAKPTIGTFTATPNKITRGEEVTLEWQVEDAERLTLKDGSNTQNVTGKTRLTVSPTETTTYTLVASNSAGSVQKSVQVGVGSGAVPVIEAFKASATTVTPDTEVTLSWQVRGADTLTLEPAGKVEGTSRTVSPSRTTTYTLKASNAFGEASASVTVRVGAAPDIVAFEASPSRIGAGQTTTLAWAVTGEGLTLSLSPDIGNVSGKSEVTLSPEKTTTYTLTARNAFGEDKATVQVVVTRRYLLNVVVLGEDGLVKSEKPKGGITCGDNNTDCQEYYDAGTSVRLKAEKEEPRLWVGCDSVFKEDKCDLVMNADRTVFVYFED